MCDGHAHERRAHGAAERARGLDQGGCDAHILPGRLHLHEQRKVWQQKAETETSQGEGQQR